VRHRIARIKCSTEDWVSVHRAAHKLGMRTTATMMFGVGETYEQRINHFEVVRRLQEETGGFTAFIPWSFQPGHTALGGNGWEEATSVEYLKVLAIARLYLDNIENVQASWVTQGLKVLELGLHFGGNDVGSVMLEENVVRAAGTSNCWPETKYGMVKSITCARSGVMVMSATIRSTCSSSEALKMTSVEASVIVFDEFLGSATLAYTMRLIWPVGVPQGPGVSLLVGRS